MCAAVVEAEHGSVVLLWRLERSRGRALKFNRNSSRGGEEADKRRLESLEF